MSTPLITVFVRHTPGCKYAGDEFCKRCNCRKHLRWTQGGKQHRRKAGTRSWTEAEEQKRRLEDQLAGRTPQVDPAETRTAIEEAVRLFMAAKKNDGLEPPSLAKLQKSVDRVQAFAEGAGL